MKSFKTLALALLLSGQMVMAADDKVMLNFVNMEIESAVKAIGLITGKNFVLDPRVKGTVNIVSSSPVAKREVFNIMLSALRLQGFAVVETSGAIKIVPEADAKQNWGVTVNRNNNVSGDRIITQVYPMKHESAAQLVPILRPLITPNNSIAAYPGANLLVITDYADNVKRLNQIIANIDQPANGEITMIPLKFASALEVAQTIGRLMPEVSTPGVVAGGIGPGLEGAKKSQVIADTRANTLLVRGDNTAHLAQIRKIAETLDRQGQSGGNIHVVYLKNADATRLAPTLKAIITGQDVPQPSSGATPGNTTPATPQPQISPSSAGLGLGAAQSTPGVAIQADATTNSLIITAPDHIYNNLRAVIDKLDARRAQVYVEAMIAEVSINKAGEFGIQWLVGGGDGDKWSVGSASVLGSKESGSNILDIAKGIATNNPTLPQGFTIGVLNGVLGKDSTNKPNLGLLATAIETNGGGNVLSTPNILTLDNEEAKIIVGQNVPFITGTQPSTGNNQNPFTTVERKDVGIQLKVKPQVSEGGAITLTVFQEVSSVDTRSNINTGNAGLITKKRSIESKVLVDDGQIIVLGGLIENDVSNGESKVPLLGDIPVLGNLFRYESRGDKRTNLMVFLRPVVLRDGQAAEALTNERYQMLQTMQREYRRDRNLMLPELPEVALPGLDGRRRKSPPAPLPPTPVTQPPAPVVDTAPVATQTIDARQK
ncbi:type II secretion system secretin GspD [Chitinimonas lacunae]|uniref:Type II secretion system secretin GspD n=1 Tax=Chitinimonas lacunae TaxID=1963018 RepID=A0ABV8MLI3_9NEIS